MSRWENHVDLELQKDRLLIFGALVLLIFDFAALGRLTPYPILPTVCAFLLVSVCAQSISTMGRRSLLAACCALFYGILVSAFYPVEFHEDVLGFLLAAAAFFAAAQISGSLRKDIEEERRQHKREKQEQALLTELNARMINARGTAPLRQQLLQSVYEVCGHPSIFYEVEEGNPVRVTAYPQGLITYSWEQEAAQQAVAEARIVGVGTEACQNSTFRYYPILFHGSVKGVVAVLFGIQGWKPTQMSMADQLMLRGTVALERQALEDEQQRIINEKQVEEMRANFLRAISHDLRSPLAVIVGACAALEQAPNVSENNRQLLGDIREESAWLTHMVENLFSITRVTSGGLNLNLQDEAVEEIVGEAAFKCRVRFPKLQLRVSVPEQLILLPMDATLVTEVILNLVENAVKYGGESQRVELEVTAGERRAVISVRDHGDGIPPEQMESIFSGKQPHTDQFRHGLGLGLSICRTVVMAHGGEIWVENCGDGGTKFCFSLPMEEQEDE